MEQGSGVSVGKQLSVQGEQSMSERFMVKVVSEFGCGVGAPALSDFQKRLAQNYFIALDAVLRTGEEKRVKGNSGKKEQYQNSLPLTWANVNLELLARNVVSAARVGLDPAQKNQINLIPYKNMATQKYDIGFIPGYRGIELQARKYGLDVPDAVIVELVFANDRFKSIKKDRTNPIETYDFAIVNDFDRGALVGGFYYHLFASAPEKNKLVVLTLREIEKRKPAHASVEFWGGERTRWKDGRPDGTEQVEGWYEDMCRKTIARAAYGNITIDSQKIDDDYVLLRQAEAAAAEAAVAAEIRVNANREAIDIEATSGPEPDGQQRASGVEGPKQEAVFGQVVLTGAAGPDF